tara:strand:- start:274 stop:744 length:471 start_codon:yes stop_codon:yes gene_type:complete
MIEQILLNLRVISKLNPQDKLDIWDSKLYIINPKFGNSFRRFITRQNREVSIDFISKLINSCIEFSNALINSKINENSSQSTDFLKDYDDNIAWKNKCDLKDLFEELVKSKNGLENFKITYNEDATIVSQIEVIINNINNQVKAIKNYMSNKSDKE